MKLREPDLNVITPNNFKENRRLCEYICMYVCKYGLSCNVVVVNKWFKIQILSGLVAYCLELGWSGVSCRVGRMILCPLLSLAGLN